MRWSHIKELQHRGHIIGAHTMDHYMINDTNIDTLDYQIGYCRSVIEENWNNLAIILLSLMVD